MAKAARAARITLGVVVVGVAAAIAVVHNMQVEERKRLHQVCIRSPLIVLSKLEASEVKQVCSSSSSPTLEEC